MHEKHTAADLAARAAIDFTVAASATGHDLRVELRKRPYHLDVHATHCCKRHGCKYGGEDRCPVVRGEVAQEYPCEMCGAVISTPPPGEDATPDDLLHYIREQVTRVDRADDDADYDFDTAGALADLVNAIDSLDRKLSTHGHALPGAWAETR